MDEKKVILVTGVADYWGAEVAAGLIANGHDSTESGGYHVIGVDVDPLQDEIDGLDFILTDISNPLFVELLKSENVHTVCHLNFNQSYYRSEKAFDVNVLGTMKVIGACAEASVKKIILKSSTMVYGANWNNPAFLREEFPIQGSKSYGYTRDLVEIESFCAGFCQQKPDLLITTLRFPNIIGPLSDTPFNQYLKLSVISVLFGFDPRMQMILETDVVRAIIHAVEHDVPGAYNVAAEGVLPLHGLIGRAGKVPFPVFHPFAYMATEIINASRLHLIQSLPIEWDYLRYTWVADITRMREIMKFKPLYTADESLRDFNRCQKLNRFSDDDPGLATDIRYMQDLIEQRSRQKDLEDQKSKE